MIKPELPGGILLISTLNSLRVLFTRSLINSVATVQFIVHKSGSQPPVELQNPAIQPLGSMIGLLEYAYKVPEVPKLIVNFPLVTFPVPIAPIMLSPPPVDTGIPLGNPYFDAKVSDVVPINSL